MNHYHICHSKYYKLDSISFVINKRAHQSQENVSGEGLVHLPYKI